MIRLSHCTSEPWPSASSSWDPITPIRRAASTIWRALYPGTGQVRAGRAIRTSAPFAIGEQQLGPDHPETAEIIHDCARFWEAQGNREEARVRYARALAIREQVFGAHHPKTMETRKHFINLLQAMGQHEQAAQLEMVQTEQRVSEEEQEAHLEG